MFCTNTKGGLTLHFNIAVGLEWLNWNDCINYIYNVMNVQGNICISYIARTEVVKILMSQVVT